MPKNYGIEFIIIIDAQQPQFFDNIIQSIKNSNDLVKVLDKFPWGSKSAFLQIIHKHASNVLQKIISSGDDLIKVFKKLSKEAHQKLIDVIFNMPNFLEKIIFSGDDLMKVFKQLSKEDSKAFVAAIFKRPHFLVKIISSTSNGLVSVLRAFNDKFSLPYQPYSRKQCFYKSCVLQIVNIINEQEPEVLAKIIQHSEDLKTILKYLEFSNDQSNNQIDFMAAILKQPKGREKIAKDINSTDDLVEVLNYCKSSEELIKTIVNIPKVIIGCIRSSMDLVPCQLSILG